MQLIVLPSIAFLAVLAIAVLLLGRHDELSQQQLILNRIAQPVPQEDDEEIEARALSSQLGSGTPEWISAKKH